MRYFLPFLFRIGITIKKTQGIKINLNQFEIGRLYETEHARFKFVSRDLCFFCHRFRFLQIRTPFPIKGEIFRDSSETILIWRIPLGSVMFFALWLFGWLSPLLFGTFKLTGSQILSADFGISVLATLFGVGVVLGVSLFSAYVEQKRARLALSELLFLSFH
jgi:hypothetical protein